MANIQVTTDEKVFRIAQFRGLNESQDGETKLKYGEADKMENWRVTAEGNLQRRPGTKTIVTLPGAVKGLWKGNINGSVNVLCASEGKLYRVYNGTWEAEELGTVDTSGDVFIFAFDNKAYIMDGSKYQVFDGTTLSEVEGYIPIVLYGASPAGSGTTLEQINKLTTKRRVMYSADGTSTQYVLPPENIATVNYVKVNGTLTTAYSYSAGKITFTTAPSAGTNTVEVCYTVQDSLRGQVERMRYAELYNGSQDTRVFVYGDGSNKCLYTGLDEFGMGRADYFPDMNEAVIGEANSPITCMIRHYNRLLAFKDNSAYTIYYSTITTAESQVIPAFIINTLNKSIGCAGYNQAQLIDNYPRALFGEDCYDWVNSAKNLSADERQARRISARINRTLSTFLLSSCKCYDDNDNKEYYISYNGMALVHNYAADAWYYYSNFDAISFCNVNGELYIGGEDGKIRKVSASYMSDDDEPIDAYWESGAMSFDADYMRKYASNLWVSVKPQSNTNLDVSCITDRKSEFATKTITFKTGGFADFDFGAFVFNDTSQPQMTRLRLKAKKFVYYKIIFKNNVKDTVATVLGVDIMSRSTGYAK